ncbi:MAG: hypothetical protein JWM80_1302 [Cyanobacteria bacterium RYN_339]|nr:hypothetical protein [Cyanobacteria bacterium RYN_339]
MTDQKIDDAAIARLPEILFEGEADALYGPVAKGDVENLSFDREMAELVDKMIMEVSAMFDEEVVDLDFSQESLEDLDRLVTQVWGRTPPEEQDVLDAISTNWGAYLGAALIHNVGGHWQFRTDLDHACVFFPRTGMAVFPMHKLRKRFRLGENESIHDFYEAIIEELTGS